MPYSDRPALDSHQPPHWNERYEFRETLLASIGITEERAFALAKWFEFPVGEKAFRDRALFHFLLRTGFSACDAVSVRWTHAVEQEKELLFALNGKKGTVCYAAPGGEAIEYVRAYHAGFLGESDLLFVSLPDRAKSNQRHPLTTRGLRKIIASWK